MNAEITFEKAKVYLNDLNDEMTILSYIGFSKKYHNLTRETCAFLKHHFKGTRALVGRHGKRYTIPIDFIQENDFLHKIDSFPCDSRMLTKVSNHLKQSLRSQGMLRFEVMQPVSLSLDNQRVLVYLINMVRGQTPQTI